LKLYPQKLLKKQQKLLKNHQKARKNAKKYQFSSYFNPVFCPNSTEEQCPHPAFCPHRPAFCQKINRKKVPKTRIISRLLFHTITNLRNFSTIDPSGILSVLLKCPDSNSDGALYRVSAGEIPLNAASGKIVKDGPPFSQNNVREPENPDLGRPIYGIIPERMGWT
jgi:hypothetical protein